jgi:hypothetical protein
MRAKRTFICVPKASLRENLRDLREKFLEFMALEGICKSFTAEYTEEYAEFAELYFEALCFIEDAEFNDPVLCLCLRHMKFSYKRVII